MKNTYKPTCLRARSTTACKPLFLSRCLSIRLTHYTLNPSSFNAITRSDFLTCNWIDLTDCHHRSDLLTWVIICRLGRLKPVPQLLIIDLVKVDASALVEKDVGSIADNLVLLGALAHLVVIEEVPGITVERICSVMASWQLALMVRDCEQVVKWSVWRSFTWDNKLAHV